MGSIAPYGGLVQLDHHSAGGAGMHEGDPASWSVARRTVQQLGSVGNQGAQLELDVVDLERNVVNALSTPAEEVSHGALCAGRLHELDDSPAGVEAHQF